MGSIPYDMKGFRALENVVEMEIRHFTQTRKKVLAIDLDNTIWGGVIGEDGPKGVVLGESLLGAAYRDVQKRIKEIGKTGILLVIVSKNNREDVDAAFANNPFMVLRKEDFVEIQANWDSKSANLRKVASNLNLGLDSIVFLDDNPVEREEVKTDIPQVTVLDFPKDVSELPNVLNEAYTELFWCERITKEDEDKTQQYKEEALRKEVLSSAVSMDEYLQSLQMHIVVGEATDEQMPRVLQLLNKTNQFNTNTLRMDQLELETYRKAEGHHIFTAEVSDRYGDSGLVVLLLAHSQKRSLVIDTFLMSCRVMGRKIEEAVFFAVARWAEQKGFLTIQGSFVQTAKNKPVENLWGKLGFVQIGQIPNGAEYQLQLPVQAATLLETEWRS